MNCIQNATICTSTPSFCNKAIMGSIAVVAISLIALGIIGLTASPSGPFNAIVQLGKTVNGALVGTSIFVFILDMVWLGTLCKHKKVSSQSPQQQQPPSQPPLVLESKPSLVLEDKEEISNKGAVSNCFVSVPNEIIVMIFSHLSASQQLTCRRVNKLFWLLTGQDGLVKAFNPGTLSSHIKIFNASNWANQVDMKAFGLTTKDVPDWDERNTTAFLEQVLSSPLLAQIEEDAGITLLTIPKGLTLNKLVKIAKKNTVPVNYVGDYILKEIGDIKVNKTYQIVITNNVFRSRRGKFLWFLANRKALLSQNGCEMPKVLEITTLFVITYMNSGEYLYKAGPYSYCQETVNKQAIVVGGTSSWGIFVHRDYNHGIHAGIYGVGGVLRL